VVPVARRRGPRQRQPPVRRWRGRRPDRLRRRSRSEQRHPAVPGGITRRPRGARRPR
jgi:hypothetical protein